MKRDPDALTPDPSPEDRRGETEKTRNRDDGDGHGLGREKEIGRTDVGFKIELSFVGNIYGRLNVSTRNFAIWARVTESSGQ